MAGSDAGDRSFAPFLVEVTVTNLIGDDGLARIRAHGQAAVEINLSRAGGVATRDDLRRLVVNDLTLKRWLRHPSFEEARATLLAKLESGVEWEEVALMAQADRQTERRRIVLAAPLANLCSEYIEAVTRLLDATAAYEMPGTDRAVAVHAVQAARERVADAADKLSLRGYPEAADDNLIGQAGVLSRILTCQLARPVGYRMANVVSVLNAIHQSNGSMRTLFTLFIIAVRVYAPPLGNRQTWFDEWASEVRESIKAKEKTYVRDSVYDRLLSLLFPEMAQAISMRGGKLGPDGEMRRGHERSAHDQHTLPARRRSQFLEQQPRADLATWALLDTGADDWWMKGRDLERWRLSQAAQ